MNSNTFANWLGQSVSIVALAAVGGMALVMHINQTQTDQMESDFAAQDRAAEMEQYYSLLHLASAGETEELRQMLSAKLASDLVLANILPPTLNAGTRDSIQRVTRRVIADEKLHPDIYLATDPRARASEMKLWAMVEQPSLLTQTGEGIFLEK